MQFAQKTTSGISSTDYPFGIFKFVCRIFGKLLEILYFFGEFVVSSHKVHGKFIDNCKHLKIFQFSFPFVNEMKSSIYLLIVA